MGVGAALRDAIVSGAAHGLKGQVLYYAVEACSFCKADLFLNYKANRGYCVPKCLGCSRVYSWGPVEHMLDNKLCMVRRKT